VATYLLIHGAQATSWYWHLVVPELENLGHEAVAVDLPSDDDNAGLREYTDAAVRALGDRRIRGDLDLIVVGQSLGGFTAPLVCAAVPVRLLVLVNAMVPRPGETAGAWWANTGHVFPENFDPLTHFLHDVPPPVAEESGRHLRDVSDTIFADPWPLDAWPDVPTEYVLCRDDHFFTADFQRRLVRERLSVVPHEMAGGHLSALSRPAELAQLLEELRLAQTRAGG
jgi:hypothetical protein